jgi:urease accessory protein
MPLTEKIGHVDTFPLLGRKIDYLLLEWFEANKRILHKKTNSGKDISMKFLQGNPMFIPGDIVFADDVSVVVIDIKEVEVIVVKPGSMQEIAAICYEIGNKHLPLFYQDEEILVAFEKPLFHFLEAAGYIVEKGMRKLTNPLKTTVAPHANSSSLFNRIMKLTTDPS